MFKILRQYLTRSRFKRQDLNIIEGIDFELNKSILDAFISEGWELSYQFSSAGSLKAQGECIVRRGQSTLSFRNSNQQQGSIVGPTRIVRAIADKYQLTALPSPSAST